MDWQIKPLAHKSAVSGETLNIGETVVCFIFVNENAEIQRVDIHEKETDQFPRPETILGRWTRVVKSRGEEEREARVQQMATAEDIFFSLFNVTDGDEATVAEREALKQVLALMLERKRVLRSQGKVKDGIQNYLHVKTKRELSVSMHELSVDELISLQEKLEALVL
ncbi:hypothetical protein [Rubellicoccus peritrichatus]|uniref:Uncharacterized protein n=1 Tax=Rubellicoccus peritrichatus TaxID=3080537 RepID=A0AAQ3L892_9BACT|nr:hypothetical protein [Puniceicoccus sp. CR14]WOO40706.1 hypothetical protein RZN69_18955 [Puniceicoccus sp. CR14]